MASGNIGAKTGVITNNNANIKNNLNAAFPTEDLAAMLWDMSADEIRTNVNSLAFETWAKFLHPFRIKDGTLLLISPNELNLSYTKGRYGKQIEESIIAVDKRLGGGVDNVVIALPTEIDEGGDYVPGGTQDVQLLIRANMQASNISPRYTFDTFVKGKANELAYSASVAVSENPGRVYNPLFIYGGVGLGKTHLMHAIGNNILKRDPFAKVLYVTSEHLTNEFVNAIQTTKNREFRDKYRKVDVLLIDDIQFISGKEGTQEEFFHTFNALYDDNKQIIITSDKPPKELKNLEERLVSRFGSGLTTDMTLPDFETRAAIIERKSRLEHMKIPADIIHYIARSISTNIRELEGALTNVIAQAKLTNTPISFDSAEKAIQEVKGGETKRELNAAYIQEVVAAKYNLTAEDLRSKKRTANVAFARHIAMYIAHFLLDSPLSELGAEFGNRDHTTVIHGCNKITQEIDQNEKTKAEVNELIKILKP